MGRLDYLIHAIGEVQNSLIFLRPADLGAEEKEGLETRLAAARRALENAREQEGKK